MRERDPSSFPAARDPGEDLRRAREALSVEVPSSVPDGSPAAVLPRALATSAHAVDPSSLLAALGTDPSVGLSGPESRARMASHGPNEIPASRRRSWLAVVASQFRSPLIYLLFLAAAVALMVGEPTDAMVILGVVIVNSAIGALQEGRAERSMAALRQLAALRARVLRDGMEVVVAGREIVPGDLLLLSSGDAVLADARLLDAHGLSTSEAALTGESLPVVKSTGALAPATPLPERQNMVYTGTHVTAGRARALVVATGLTSEVGGIALMTEGAREPDTPLQQRLSRLGRTLVVAAGVLFALVMSVGALRGLPRAEVLMIAIAQVVGMIPEGLPVAMTIGLAIGMQRMAARRAIVSRLSAVETLGSVSVIATDKTGTLTKNEMTVTRIALPGGRDVRVTGVGYATAGELLENSGHVKVDEHLARLLVAGVLCGDARVEQRGAQLLVSGDPTEAALVTLAVKGGLDPGAVRAREPRVAELPFDPALRLMATQHAGSRARVVLKGAPESVLGLCTTVLCGSAVAPLDAAARGEIQEAAESMGRDALRVLALAEAEGAAIDHSGLAAVSGRATFLGLVGELDPPRPETAAAVARCRGAGIRTVMLTGDHKATALAIARLVGIAEDGDAVLDGTELGRLSDDELSIAVQSVGVFARVEPAHKLRIVEALQARGETVAMTGDGVNDAPALARADIGVAMGITGTDVAKQAAKVVITDDDFATIVQAVAEGRLVHANLKKSILLLFSTSFAEVAVLLGAMTAGLPLPFAAVQILWNNVVTEGLVTVNLAMEAHEGDEMQRRPISRDAPLVTRSMLRRMSLMTTTIAVATLGFFAHHLATGVPFAQAQTATFTLLAVMEWFNVLNCRSELRSALHVGILGNPWLLAGVALGNVLHVAVVFVPWLNSVFHTVPIPLSEALLIGLVGSSVLWVEEARKWWARRSLGS